MTEKNLPDQLWANWELEYLDKHYEADGPRDVARVLARPYGSVETRWRRRKQELAHERLRLELMSERNRHGATLAALDSVTGRARRMEFYQFMFFGSALANLLMLALLTGFAQVCTLN